MFVKNYKITTRVIYGESFSPFETSFEVEVGEDDDLMDVKKFLKQESDSIIKFCLHQAKEISNQLPERETKNTYKVETVSEEVVDKETMLNTRIPDKMVGKTGLAGESKFGKTLRACSKKELEFFAYTSKVAQKSVVGKYAKELLENGYEGYQKFNSQSKKYYERAY